MVHPLQTTCIYWYFLPIFLFSKTKKQSCSANSKIQTYTSKIAGCRFMVAGSVSCFCKRKKTGHQGLFPGMGCLGHHATYLHTHLFFMHNTGPKKDVFMGRNFTKVEKNNRSHTPILATTEDCFAVLLCGWCRKVLYEWGPRAYALSFRKNYVYISV